MATEFRITIVHPDQRYARQAAAEAWIELDRLESLLSRFCSAGDIARIGALAPGESVLVAPETWECLRIALALEQATGGAFNIAYACRPRRLAGESIRLLEGRPMVAVTAHDTRLDLGGLGKGFALDCLAVLLAAWDLERYLLQASASTLLAGDPPPESSGWAIRFGPPDASRRHDLVRAAWSGSGSAIKGGHIVDPRTGQPARRYRQAWAGAPSAAEADGLSTALMVMPRDAAERFCGERPDVRAYVLPAEGGGLQRLHASPDD
jgi:FAD:protein FMN transferase